MKGIMNFVEKYIWYIIAALVLYFLVFSKEGYALVGSPIGPQPLIVTMNPVSLAQIEERPLDGPPKPGSI